MDEQLKRENEELKKENENLKQMIEVLRETIIRNSMLNVGTLTRK